MIISDLRGVSLTIKNRAISGAQKSNVNLPPTIKAKKATTMMRRDRPFTFSSPYPWINQAHIEVF
jgi:hypothetical protein